MQFTSPCVYLSNFQTIHAANFKCHISIARNNASNSIEATRGERKTFTILHFVGEIHPRSRVSEQMLRLFRKLEKLNVQRIYKICCRINSCAVKYKMQSAKKKKKRRIVLPTIDALITENEKCCKTFERRDSSHTCEVELDVLVRTVGTEQLHIYRFFLCVLHSVFVD